LTKFSLPWPPHNHSKDISFDEAEATLGAFVSFLETQQIVPFTFPLPD
jgi:hypothetical protein